VCDVKYAGVEDSASHYLECTAVSYVQVESNLDTLLQDSSKCNRLSSKASSCWSTPQEIHNQDQNRPKARLDDFKMCCNLVLMSRPSLLVHMQHISIALSRRPYQILQNMIVIFLFELNSMAKIYLYHVCLNEL
jgi:hypothetical protein